MSCVSLGRTGRDLYLQPQYAHSSSFPLLYQNYSYFYNLIPEQASSQIFSKICMQGRGMSSAPVIEFQRHCIAPSDTWDPASTTFSVDLPLQQLVNEGVLSKPKGNKIQPVAFHIGAWCPTLWCGARALQNMMSDWRKFCPDIRLFDPENCRWPTVITLSLANWRQSTCLLK